MAKQWNKDEKIEILEFSKQNGVRSSAEKYNVAKSTIQRWRTEAEENVDNLEWGRGLQTIQHSKRRMKASKVMTDDVTKMSRFELEEIAKLHLALKKYEAKTIKDKFLAINNLSADYSVDFLCRKLKVTRQGYYLWIKNGMPKHKNYNIKFANTILELFNKFIRYLRISNAEYFIKKI